MGSGIYIHKHSYKTMSSKPIYPALRLFSNKELNILGLVLPFRFSNSAVEQGLFIVYVVVEMPLLLKCTVTQ